MDSFINTLLSFGSGTNGQIPYFGFKTIQQPQVAHLPHEPTELFSQGSSTVFAKTENHIYSWGRGENYVLGTGTNSDSFTPQEVPLPPTVTQIAVSNTHAAAITSEGELYTWGTRALGRGKHESELEIELKSTPIPVTLPIDGLQYSQQTALSSRFNDDNKPHSLAVGCNHTLLATKRGDVWGFGSNFDGALGLGSDKHAQYLTPTKIAMPNDEKIDKVYSGLRYSLFKAKSGRLFGCGDNSYGSVGVGDVGVQFVRTPTQIQLPSSSNGRDIEIDEVSAGPFHACFNTKDGELFCWGQNVQSQLGLALQANRSVGKIMTPVRNEFFKQSDIFVKKVKCGSSHTAVLDSNNQLWLFGSGKDGQLSNLNVTSTGAHDTPFLAPLPDFDLKSIELGSNTTYLLAKPKQKAE